MAAMDGYAHACICQSAEEARACLAVALHFVLIYCGERLGAAICVCETDADVTNDVSKLVARYMYMALRGRRQKRLKLICLEYLVVLRVIVIISNGGCFAEKQNSVGRGAVEAGASGVASMDKANKHGEKKNWNR